MLGDFCWECCLLEFFVGCEFGVMEECVEMFGFLVCDVVVWEFL